MKKIQIKNTAGMFDFLKGITMMVVVIEHTLQDVGSSDYGRALNLLGVFMAALFIISGYGFRKKPIKKVFAQQAKLILVPYAITAGFICVGHCLARWIVFGSKRIAVIETLKVFAGLALGLADTLTIKGISLFSCGPMWYLLALFWGWIILTAIFTFIPEKMHIIVVLIVSIVGMIISYFTCSPFGISRGMFTVIFIYMGCYCKKHKLFTEEWSLKFKILFPLIVVAVIALGLMFPQLKVVLAIIAIPLSVIFPIIFLKLFLLLNIIFTGAISNKIRTIGRYSLYFLCVHTFEYIVIPWYLVAERVNSVATLIMVCAIRFFADVLLCAFVVTVMPTIKETISKRLVHKVK